MLVSSLSEVNYSNLDINSDYLKYFFLKYVKFFRFLYSLSWKNKLFKNIYTVNNLMPKINKALYIIYKIVLNLSGVICNKHAGFL